MNSVPWSEVPNHLSDSHVHKQLKKNFCITPLITEVLPRIEMQFEWLSYQVRQMVPSILCNHPKLLRCIISPNEISGCINIKVKLLNKLKFQFERPYKIFQ